MTGVPGSGKSTLLAAGTRRLLERGAGRIQSYEAPIEYVFDGIATDTALMSSAEIPRHFPSFADGLRSSLRRRPSAVIVGEARDRETVEAVVRAADYGIAVFSTAHTVGVAATVRRLLAEFPAGERAERGAALIDAMTLVVTQVLLPNPRGGRTALREWLAFDAGLKAALLESPQSAWPATIAAALAKTGNTLAAAAKRAFREGSIGEDGYRRVLAGAGAPAGRTRQREGTVDEGEKARWIHRKRRIRAFPRGATPCARYGSTSSTRACCCWRRRGCFCRRGGRRRRCWQRRSPAVLRRRGATAWARRFGRCAA